MPTIQLLDGSQPRFTQPYRMSQWILSKFESLVKKLLKERRSMVAGFFLGKLVKVQWLLPILAQPP
jgi:hypothetical protein